MEELMMDEQDLSNAICLYIAEEKQTEPRHVEVELAYDDQEGFSAEAYFSGRKQALSHFEMIKAIRIWINEVLEEDPNGAAIELALDDVEGIVAHLR